MTNKIIKNFLTGFLSITLVSTLCFPSLAIGLDNPNLYTNEGDQDLSEELFESNNEGEYSGKNILNQSSENEKINSSETVISQSGESVEQNKEKGTV